jgi:hypothetical protein
MEPETPAGVNVDLTEHAPLNVTAGWENFSNSRWNGGMRTMEQTLQSLSDFDVYLLAEGTFDRAYEKLGAHLTERDGRQGVQFAVWAPNAKLVSVVGDFNQWNPAANVMRSSPAGVVWRRRGHEIEGAG